MVGAPTLRGLNPAERWRRGSIVKEQRPDNWVAFRNKRAEPGRKHPDLVGRAAVTCTHCGGVSDLEIAAWRYTSHNADVGEYQSGTFRPWRGSLPPIPGDPPPF